MLIEMRARSQITLPNELTKRMGISEGDRFEVMERDGGVFLCPVVVYPKAKLEKIAQIIREHEKEPSAVYSSVEDMFNDLGISLGGDKIGSLSPKSLPFFFTHKKSSKYGRCFRV